eukprot:TRINITY_DN8700_c0_g1_i1.p1 TRINITY_DN8700_c0_g1~~TRINITY_DN8700_c0_g1_i1.p1  ORF type:complete len:573 (+),score=181.64 TRINITY_DN8700_c0_g1_i1:94-1812(+)
MLAVLVVGALALAPPPDPFQFDFVPEFSLEFGTDTVDALHFSDDGWWVALGFAAGYAVAYDIHDRKAVEVRALDGGEEVRALELAGTGLLAGVHLAPGTGGGAGRVAFRHIADVTVEKELYALAAGETLRGFAMHKENQLSFLCTSAGVKVFHIDGDFQQQNASLLTVTAKPAVTAAPCAAFAVAESGRHVLYHTGAEVKLSELGGDGATWGELATVAAAAGAPSSVSLSLDAKRCSVVDAPADSSTAARAARIYTANADRTAWTAGSDFTVHSRRVAVSTGVVGEHGQLPWELYAYATDARVVISSGGFGSAVYENDGTTTLADLGTHGNQYARTDAAHKKVSFFRGCVADMVLKHYNIPSNGFAMIETATQQECHDKCCEAGNCRSYQWIEAPPTETKYPHVQCLVFEESTGDLILDNSQPFHTFAFRNLAPPFRDPFGYGGDAGDDGLPTAAVVVLVILAVVAALVCCAAAVLLLKNRRLAGGAGAKDAGKNNVNPEIDRALLQDDQLQQVDPSTRAAPEPPAAPEPEPKREPEPEEAEAEPVKRTSSKKKKAASPSPASDVQVDTGSL